MELKLLHVSLQDDHEGQL